MKHFLSTFQKRYCNKEHLGLLLYFLFISFVLMLICTRSSFLYPLNNWDDSNSYFSMGKAMFHGKVIYRELFDQKGPYLYFLYGLASLISYTTFAGVFVFEIIWGVLDLIGMYKILRLWISRSTVLVLLPFAFAVMFSSYSFYWGGASEEFCMPTLIWALYVALRRLVKEPQTSYTYREVAIVGLLCGFVLCTKFTLLGFFFTFMVLVLFESRSIKRFLISCIVFLAAMFTPAIPWIIYFGLNGALYDWYYVYIYCNVFLYSSWGANDNGTSWPEKIQAMTVVLQDVFDRNRQYFYFIILGCAYMLLQRGRYIVLRFAFPLFYLFTTLAIYIGGGRLPYYSIPFIALAVIGFVPIGLFIDHLIRIAGQGITIYRQKMPQKSSQAKWQHVSFFTCCTIAITLSFMLVYNLSMNTYYLSYTKDDMFQPRFAADIAADGLENPTLLNFNCLDCGLYTAAGIVPNCYWFQSQTLPEPDALEIQKDYYRAHMVDYVVVRGEYYESLTDNYDLIDEFHQVMNSDTFDYPEFDYYLFRLKGVLD